MRKYVFLFLVLAQVVSCKGKKTNEEGAVSDSTAPLQLGTAISEDTAKLAKLIDLKRFPPTGAVFKWNGQDINNLEAILYYDERTYGEILEAYMNAGFPKGNFNKEQFNFSWLDSAQQAELHFSKPDYPGNPDLFLGTGDRGMLWFLDRKLLLKVQP